MRIERKRNSSEKYAGRIITVTVDEVEIEGENQIATREIAWHPGAVCVLFINDGKMLLVEQYRYALSQATYEVPAGKLDAGELPLIAARRELAEETGYEAGTLELIYDYYSAPGFTNERIYFYLATDVQTTDAYALDEDEYINVHWVTKAQVRDMLAKNEVADAKTIIAMQYWLANDGL